MIRYTKASEYSVRSRSSAEIRFMISSVWDSTALECSAENSIRFFCCFNLRMLSLICFSLWSIMSFSSTARTSSRSNSVSNSLILFSITMGLASSFSPAMQCIRVLFFPSQVSNLGGEGLGEGESGKPPRPASRRGSKKGRTTPLYLEG